MGQTVEGRVPLLAAGGDFLPVHAQVVLPGGGGDGVVGGIVGLDDCPPGIRTSPGPARDLAKKAESPFSGAKVRQTDSHVGKNGSNQGHVGDIKPLGNHLGADEHLGLARRQAAHHLMGAVPAAGGIHVPTVHPDAGQETGCFLGHALGADAQLPDASTPALPAGRGHATPAIALVAQ